MSMHETGEYLFPGTGFASEVGTGAGRGASVNVALPMGTDDAGWLQAFSEIVPPVLRAFRPQLLFTQFGCDTHVLDPLAHLELSVDGQRTAYRLLHELAHELCDGKWIAVGGGGYEIVQVVPRAWTHAIAEMVGASAVGATPADWRELAFERSGELAPLDLRDGLTPEWSVLGAQESGPLARAVNATRNAVFPLLGVA
jgi:acetoin utilization protein AcuC